MSNFCSFVNSLDYKKIFLIVLSREIKMWKTKKECIFNVLYISIQKGLLYFFSNPYPDIKIFLLSFIGRSSVPIINPIVKNKHIGNKNTSRKLFFEFYMTTLTLLTSKTYFRLHIFLRRVHERSGPNSKCMCVKSDDANVVLLYVLKCMIILKPQFVFWCETDEIQKWIKTTFC